MLGDDGLGVGWTEVAGLNGAAAEAVGYGAFGGKKPSGAAVATRERPRVVSAPESGALVVAATLAAGVCALAEDANANHTAPMAPIVRRVLGLGLTTRAWATPGWGNAAVAKMVLGRTGWRNERFTGRWDEAGLDACTSA